MCLSGASGAGAELLRALPDADLRAFFVWIPMLPPDNVKAAQAASERFAEPRASHYWDRERQLGRQLARALGIRHEHPMGGHLDEGIAWDLYLAFRRGNPNIFEPDLWMHQLSVTHAPRLDATVWRERVEEMLSESQTA